MIPPWLRRAEPHRVVVARYDVPLHAEIGNRKIVDDVFAGEDQLDVAAHRNVELVDLAQASRLLRLPHPLLANDIDIKRIERWTPKVDVDDRAAGEHRERQQQGHDKPNRLKPHVAVDRNADFAWALTLVFEEEKDHRGSDGDREKEADRGDVHHQGVDAGSEVGRLLRIQW